MSDNNDEKRGPLAELMDLAEGITQDQKAGDNYSLAGDRNWKVLETIDDEDFGGSGMYGCLIDKGDGTCAIVFRGTVLDEDPLEKIEDGIQDIFGADLGLVNNGETDQQIMARLFTEEMYKKYGGRFKEFTFVGHSLGGNLAEHALITAPPELQAKSSAVSLDGPGFSARYIAEHAAEIEAVKGKLDRYQWSFVGACLNTLPGERYENLKIDGRDYFDENDAESLEKFISNNSPLCGDIPGFFGRQIDKHADYNAIREGRYIQSEMKEKDISLVSRVFDALQSNGLDLGFTSILPGTVLTNMALDAVKEEYMRARYQNNTKRESAEINDESPEASSGSAKGPVQFSVDPQKIGSCAAKLDDTATGIERINDDLLAVRREISPFITLNRMNLRVISKRLEKEEKKCKLMSAGLKDITVIYDREENKCVEYAGNA